MLVLTRVAGTTVIIDHKIKVTVLEIDGHQVRLGIDAPRHITVNRLEVENRINQEGGQDDI